MFGQLGQFEWFERFEFIRLSRLVNVFRFSGFVDIIWFQWFRWFERVQQSAAATVGEQQQFQRLLALQRFSVERRLWFVLLGVVERVRLGTMLTDAADLSDGPAAGCVWMPWIPGG